ncbi:MAG: hypothetical protein FJ316_09045 [SAR202 cluster bacterium]|nr:hypothetical protein [SAR202 cluster bacterium]
MTQLDSITGAETQAQAPVGCRHYWVIQPATGSVSQGVCQTCGQVKEFKNYVEATTWGDDRAPVRGRRGQSMEPEGEEFLEGEAA